MPHSAQSCKPHADPGEQALPLVVIAGATATGKSALAIDTAERIGGEVINADALQFYRGMDVGTAKVTRRERRGIPHHLLDILDVTEEASVATFQREARRLADEIRERGKLPVVVGGSGLYVRAFTDVMAFPPSDPAVRTEIEAHVREVGTGAAHAELAKADPAAAKKIAPRDERRIVRALEVHRLTGKPFSAFLPTYTFHDPAIAYVAVSLERERLHERVEARVHRMIEEGFREEVEELLDIGIERGVTARQAIGYAQMIAHVRGKMSLDEAIDSTITNTRRLVRKQDTWFRRDTRLTWVPGEDSDAALAMIEREIAHAAESSSRLKHEE
ncbi:tRNA (adenosine(37)-N6)-dimethylallyltransferase MiaA [Dermabacter sp. p3-SID358]|uniref:tRNA (adenosine(37)-N6)-dimethylallyltransferase MiaA n=1 Tax=Dermabacter sp. p3-SID358 TaxID=2916114 RepID=UPI0021A2BCA2|nr:tRNA (adenosine(37)-N6)-dimethylallyltransferase MiaA [Dermabacter sp. p3-SID358]MCT1867260.1 tRNA (adenosine(37)-N6)-dimethylallyltransferase MiaA [Dermabacter sp. p3-SID358]